MDTKDLKIKELNSICMLLVERFYNFLGNLDKKHLDNFELVELNRLKATIDSCINDDNFKAYLQSKYIDKDFNECMTQLAEAVSKKNEAIQEESAHISDAFIKTNLEEEFKEDDTDTIKTISRKDNSKSHLKKGITYYNIKTKTFIKRK